MTCRGDEVQAGVDARVVVGVQYPADLQFLLQVGFELGINEFHDGLVAKGESKKMARTLQNGHLLGPHMSQLMPICAPSFWNVHFSLLIPILPF